MIFVILGTQKFSFDRVINYLDEIFKIYPDQKIIIQAGNTHVNNGLYEIHDFLEKEEYFKLVNKADFVVCHGGVGSIHDLLYKDKKVICIPRKKEFNEHVDDHQSEICNKYEENGYILCANTKEDFVKCVANIDKFIPKKIIIPENGINDYLIRYLKNE